MIRVHQDFQGRHYAHLGKDPDARVRHVGHPAYDLAERFADEWDQVAFDPGYDTEPPRSLRARGAQGVRRPPTPPLSAGTEAWWLPPRAHTMPGTAAADPNERGPLANIRQYPCLETGAAPCAATRWLGLAAGAP